MYFWTGTPTPGPPRQHRHRWCLRRDGASLGLVKRNQINLQLDLVPFNQLQRRMRYGTRCVLTAPARRGCCRGAERFLGNAVLTSPEAPATSGRHAPAAPTSQTRLRPDPARLPLQRLPPRPAHHGVCWLCHRGDRRDRTRCGCGAGSPGYSGLHQSRNYSLIRGHQNDVSSCHGQWRESGHQEPGGHGAVACDGKGNRGSNHWSCCRSRSGARRHPGVHLCTGVYDSRHRRWVRGCQDDVSSCHSQRWRSGCRERRGRAAVDRSCRFLSWCQNWGDDYAGATRCSSRCQAVQEEDKSR
ncbi:uncharacterized protein LOC142419385 [Mycteria americana]|uniref:uncharacterized protein LOC142419385 n=1 Tax=Mycteria americana TaxID=33587 RepID=UPI003F5832BB